jgi:hypothetical protein
MQVVAVMTAFPSFSWVVDSTKPSRERICPQIVVVGGSVCPDPCYMEENQQMDRSFQSDTDLDWDDEDLSGKQRRDREAARSARRAAQKEWLDEKLDEALEETFPGSDPVSIAQPPQSPYDKPKL